MNVTERRIVVIFGAFFNVLAILVNIAIVLVIGYLVLMGQWIPAIFFLLARKDIIKGLDAAADRAFDIAKSN